MHPIPLHIFIVDSPQILALYSRQLMRVYSAEPALVEAVNRDERLTAVLERRPDCIIRNVGLLDLRGLEMPDETQSTSLNNATVTPRASAARSASSLKWAADLSLRSRAHGLLATHGI